MHILDQDAPGLADKLATLSLEQRRLVLAKTCRFASELIEGVEPEVSFLVEAVARELSLPEADVTRAQTLAEAADERYFTLQEVGAPESVWLPWFFKARLLTGIAIGFGDETWTNAVSSVYEFSNTTDDPRQVLYFVQTIVRDI